MIMQCMRLSLIHEVDRTHTFLLESIAILRTESLSTYWCWSVSLHVPQLHTLNFVECRFAYQCSAVGQVSLHNAKHLPGCRALRQATEHHYTRLKYLKSSRILLRLMPYCFDSYILITSCQKSTFLLMLIKGT